MEYDYPTAIGQLDVVLDGWENLATEYDERLQWKILRGERPQHKEWPGRWPNLPYPSVGATTACIVRKVPGERKTIKNEEGETTGESGITSALSYYLPNILRLWRNSCKSQGQSWVWVSLLWLVLPSVLLLLWQYCTSLELARTPLGRVHVSCSLAPSSLLSCLEHLINQVSLIFVAKSCKNRSCFTK